MAKAFGAGADFVMLGGMLSGHDESGGALVERGGKKFKQFYGYVYWSLFDLFSLVLKSTAGNIYILKEDIQCTILFSHGLSYRMSSATAMHKYSGGVAEYRASEVRAVSKYQGEGIVTSHYLLLAPMVLWTKLL